MSSLGNIQTCKGVHVKSYVQILAVCMQNPGKLKVDKVGDTQLLAVKLHAWYNVRKHYFLLADCVQKQVADTQVCHFVT